ncbi:MAG TPA: glutamate--tRNA ligase [Spirochaetota bacterium]|nr:glutamate--tRNA ligase [Spirochaetota bacterium]HOL56000.1 glutamate--tRNA ligase [Spirochaetota bacterium]HPP03442.1 glutamate--tRNA ligase [Spirochaetota bacterium]
MKKEIRVRYAPSPTGYQHIGGLRTALFNYLFAKANNGKFILRIEDTDQTRYFEGALEDIFETFKWIGIDYDEGPGKEGPYAPYFQSQRLKIYKEHAELLVQKGWAYYCYCDPERLERVKKEQEEKKLSIVGYDRHCRNLTEKERKEMEEKGITPVIRFKAPVEGKTSFEDKILGKIEVDNSSLQDFILLKSDGFPTYHLANIVDDHLMGITHVLRAQEWIPSTPNHVLLYKAFGWEPPIFAHLPMVMGEDGHKLSKRHGATQVMEFRKNGYLPEALLNFVALLGWSYNDSQEIFSLEELSKLFNIEKINKAPAIFNYQKLKYFNSYYIKKLSEDKFLDLILPYFIEKKLISSQPTKEELDYLKKLLPLIQPRIETLNEATDIVDFMFGDLPQYKNWEAIIPKKVEKETVLKILEKTKEILKDLNKESDDEIQNRLYKLAEEFQVKAGSVFMPLRIAITGTNKSPELFPIMHILGIDKVLIRIDNAIEKLKE